MCGGIGLDVSGGGGGNVGGENMGPGCWGAGWGVRGDGACPEYCGR